MKILLLGPEQMNHTYNVNDSLQKLGHDTVLLPIADFYTVILKPYWKRRLYNWGMKYWEKWYDDKIIKDIKNICHTYKPNLIFVLNGHMVNPYILAHLDDYYKILWLWDSVRRASEYREITPYFDEIFVFEKSDCQYFLDKYQRQVEHVLLGYDEGIYFPSLYTEKKDIDIAFIGSPHHRLEMVEYVCAYGLQNNLSIFIGGPWYTGKHFWKKWQFEHKYKNLCHYLHNRYFDAKEVAEIYKRSKICLNFNPPEHKNINPRAFEILATKSMMIMNAGQELLNIIEPSRDFVEYTDVTDLRNKLDFYLTHDDLREQIAANGLAKIYGKYSIFEMTKKIMTNLMFKQKG